MLLRLLWCAVLCLSLAEPAVAAGPPVRVGSKIDTEGALLGNIVIAVLQAEGIKTENRLQLGSTKIVRSALIAGEIDVYPDYTGNGALFFSDEANPVWRNAEEGYQRVKALDLAANRLVWLKPAPADNGWAIAVRRDVADANHLNTLDDFGKWVTGGGTVKLAASAEFVERPDALPAFQKAYGFTLKQDQLLTFAGGDTAVTIKAAADRSAGVNAAMVYGTSGALGAVGLVVMTDSKQIQRVNRPAAIVRQDVLALHPGVGPALETAFDRLDTPTLQTLNARIEIEGQDARTVARDYLKSLPK